MKKAAPLEDSKDPPLEYTFQASPFEGVGLFISGCKRGELAEQFVKWSGGPLACNSPSAKIRLQLMAARMRIELAKAGYPTDRDYMWLRQGGEDWRPDNDPDRSTDDRPHELRTWHDQLVAMTEPLSRARIQGDVLHSIDQILTKNLEEHVLRPLLQFALAWGQLRIAGEINELAIDGAARKQALLQGGKARAKIGAKNLKLVCELADKYWREKPVMRGDRGSTAESIAPTVNEALLAAGARPLRAKRIADLISKGIRGGLLLIG